MFHLKGVVTPWDSPAKFALLHGDKLRGHYDALTAVTNVGPVAVFYTLSREVPVSAEDIRARVAAEAIGACMQAHTEQPEIRDIRAVQFGDEPTAPTERPGVIFYEG